MGLISISGALRPWLTVLDGTLICAAASMGTHYPIVEDGHAVMDTSKEMAVWKEWEQEEGPLHI